MVTHGGTVPLEAEALLADDPELQLARAPMTHWLEAEPCANECCEADSCTCSDDDE